MGHALGNTLAVATAVFPIPIIAAVLLVASPRGDAKGHAFALAWGSRPRGLAFVPCAPASVSFIFVVIGAKLIGDAISGFSQ